MSGTDTSHPRGAQARAALANLFADPAPIHRPRAATPVVATARVVLVAVVIHLGVLAMPHPAPSLDTGQFNAARSMAAAGVTFTVAAVLLAPVVATGVVTIAVLAAAFALVMINDTDLVHQAVAGVVAAVLAGVLLARMAERYWWSLISLIACGTLSLSTEITPAQVMSPFEVLLARVSTVVVQVPGAAHVVQVPSADAIAFGIVAATAIRFRLSRPGIAAVLVGSTVIAALAALRVGEPVLFAPIMALLVPVLQVRYLFSSSAGTLSRMPLLRRRTVRRGVGLS